MTMFDKDNAKSLLKNDMKRLVSSETFNYDSIKKVSAATAGVAAWILNLIEYVKLCEKLKK
jgi:hypothetical protein